MAREIAPAARTTQRRKAGVAERIGTALWGERDAIAEQLREIAHQGKGMARLAHFCAFEMLVLFSLGSLIGIAGESATAFLSAWQHHQLDVIHGIAAGVSMSLVLCMDVASLYAALILRILAARRARLRDMAVHIAAILLADALEAEARAPQRHQQHPQRLAHVTGPLAVEE